MKKAIGIDLGGTEVLGGIIDLDGNIIKIARRSNSFSSGREETLDLIRQVIDELIEEGIIGIGIGSPGFIDSRQGKVLQVGGNIEGWANTNISERLKEVYREYPIFIENDANLAAVCEGWIGAAENFQNFLMLTIGTGVGGAVFLENYGVLKGANYQGAEFGHTILYPSGRACNCGQAGCAEKYISGRAIEEIYEELSGKPKSGRDIFKNQNDKIARKVVEDFTKNLAVFLVTLKNIFDPEAIIIGGGVINSKKYWWNNFIINYKNLSNEPESMYIEPANFLNDSGMIGAGKLVFDKLLKKNF